jgi:hypothetical protein
MQLLVESPHSQCFHVNSHNLSATESHHQAYILICVNCYTILYYYIARENCTSEKVYCLKNPNWFLLNYVIYEMILKKFKVM